MENQTPGVELVVPLEPLFASRRVAALMLAGSGYMWVYAFLHLLGTWTTFWGTYQLYSAMGGDSAAIWLYTSVIALGMYLALYYVVFRKRETVGSLRLWTIVFALSVVIAPLIAEIGVSPL